jgi:hypothetical protein
METCPTCWADVKPALWEFGRYGNLPYMLGRRETCPVGVRQYGNLPYMLSEQHDSVHKGKYWKRYSGLFVLLKQKITLTHQALEQVILAVQRAFACLVLGDIRCYV